MAEEKTLANYFSKITVKQFPLTEKNDGNVVQVKLTDPIKDTMLVLNKHNIYSAPIYDEEKKQYVGMIDLADIVDFIAKNFEETQMLGKGFEAIFEQAEKFISAKVSDVSAHCHRTTFVPVSIHANMMNVASLLKQHNVHRVNVLDDEGNLVNIITKSAIIEQLHKHHELLGDTGSMTLAQLKLGTPPGSWIDIKDQTVKAFLLLRSSNRYAIPVVNKELGNSIVATISVKDIRSVCVDPSRMHLLYSPVTQFLAANAAENVNIKCPSITCTNEDPLKLIIDKLAVNKIHRVYVLNKNNVPIKEISLTDILNCLV